MKLETDELGNLRDVPELPKLNKLAGGIATIVGLALLALAVAMETAWNVDNVFVSIVVNTGVAVGLFAAFAFLEPRILVRIASAARLEGTCRLGDGPPAPIFRNTSTNGHPLIICKHKSPVGPHMWLVDTLQLWDGDLDNLR